MAANRRKREADPVEVKKAVEKRLNQAGVTPVKEGKPADRQIIIHKGTRGHIMPSDKGV